MATQATLSTTDARAADAPRVRRISPGDVKDALAAGYTDFLALRTDVIFLATIYPVVGLILARIAARHDMLPLIFPLASGFALLGPFAAIGLYELSRRRERRERATYRDAFGILRSPSIWAITALALVLMAIFIAWLWSAMALYRMIFGDAVPASVGGFLGEVFTTGSGWLLIIAGSGVGFCFAVVVLVISIVSFPLLLDRRVGALTAVLVSLRAAAANPGPTALWGAIVAGGLIVGSLPFLLGLAIVLPILGHGSWHLYRRMVVPDDDHASS